uniref:Uncharacterized protein n=1 Tax=viral metagenome TaxID=1070528 RepID=A0A6M3IW08_9ZZZZ
MTKEQLDRIAAVGEQRLCRADFLDLVRLARRVVAPTAADVERVARALWDETGAAYVRRGHRPSGYEWGDGRGIDQDVCREAARAILAAMAKGGDDG